MKPILQYSEAFKMEVVREMETLGLNANQARQKYGIVGIPERYHRVAA
jgi:hypothetical protein